MKLQKKTKTKDRIDNVHLSDAGCNSANSAAAACIAMLSTSKYVNAQTQSKKSLPTFSPRKQKLRKIIRKVRLQKTTPDKEDDLNDFKNICNKFLPENLAHFIVSQAKLFKKGGNKSGNRYSMEFKQFALTIFFLSPKASSFIANTFCLPSKRSLQRITQNLQYVPGLYNEVLTLIKIKMDDLDDKTKYCTLCIDEMSTANSIYFTIYLMIL